MMGSDLEVAAFVAGVEQAVVTVYRDAIAGQRLDGATIAMCDLFASHHGEHAAVFSGLAGRDVAGGGNGSVLAFYRPQVQDARNQRAVLEIVHQLEERVASTHLAALELFDGQRSRTSTAAVLGVECQHAAVLATLLDRSLEQTCPDFEAGAGAFDPETFPA
jgi:hypothetical protein